MTSIGNILRQRQQQRRRSELDKNHADYEPLPVAPEPEGVEDAPKPVKIEGKEVSAILSELGVVASGFVVNHLVNVTPEIAEAWLGMNSGNRKPSTRKVVRFAAMHTDDEFDSLNGECAKWDVNWNLLDGQSRLMAIVMSGKAMVMEVRTGLQPEAQRTMDTGENRKLHHELEMAGYKNSVVLSVIIRAFHLYLEGNGHIEVKSASRSHYLTNRQGLKYAEEHPGMLGAIHFSNSLKLRKYLPVAKMALLKYLFDKSDKDHSESFFEEVKYGTGLAAGDPTLALRNRIDTAEHEGDPLPNAVRIALFIKAWNAHVQGSSITNMIARKGESGPEIHGKPFIDFDLKYEEPPEPAAKPIKKVDRRRGI